MKKPEFNYDTKTLREIPIDSEYLKKYIQYLEAQLNMSADITSRVQILGELGVYLRSAGRLAEAQGHLEKALLLIQQNRLGIKKEIQQKIRLAHVFHWQKNFENSNQLFDEIIKTCQKEPDAKVYLDFSLQHAGKNFFDQQHFEEAVFCFERALEIRLDQQAAADLIESSKMSLEEAQRRLQKN